MMKERENQVIPVEEDEISLLDLFVVLWKKKFLILGITLIAAVGSVVYALLQVNLYSASATVLPISKDQGSSLSQYSSLAQMAGITLPTTGQSSPVAKIQAILKSRTLAERIIQDLKLTGSLIKEPESIKPPRTLLGVTLDYFREEVFTVSVDEKTGIITVSALTEDPELSRDIANRAVILLESILNEKAMTVSKKNRLLLESQIAEQEAKVKSLQNDLTEYQKSTRILTPQGQVEQTMALYSSLIQQKISTEIELSRLESALSADNPKIIALKTQLEAVNQQIDSLIQPSQTLNRPSLMDTPEAVIRYQNIMQELEIASKIYGGLLASLENLKLMEVEDTLFVEIIDSAIAPEEKSKPSRAIICIVGTMAGFFLSVLLAFILNAWKNVKVEFKNRLKPET